MTSWVGSHWLKVATCAELRTCGAAGWLDHDPSQVDCTVIVRRAPDARAILYLPHGQTGSPVETATLGAASDGSWHIGDLLGEAGEFQVSVLGNR